jgi:23S rRNA pseudouridine1911/1915/1917 synthase
MQWRADLPDDMAALCAALGFPRDDAGEFGDEYTDYADDGDEACDNDADSGDIEDWDDDADEDDTRE